MENNSIWKRVGGWITGNRFAKIGDDINSVDAEGVLVDVTADNSDEPLALKNIQSLASVQDGFSRLTEVIREMNDNVTRHREQAADLNQKITAMIQALPEGLSQQNKCFEELTEQLKAQSAQQEQFSEMLSSLPEDSRRQLENLNKIVASLENSLEHQVSQSELFGQFNTNVKSVSEHSQAQAASLANIGNMLEENQKHLQEMITVQNKRFNKLFLATTILALAAIAAVAAVIWLATKQGS